MSKQYVVARGRTVEDRQVVDGAIIRRSYQPGDVLPAHVLLDLGGVAAAITAGWIVQEGTQPKTGIGSAADHGGPSPDASKAAYGPLPSR